MYKWYQVREKDFIFYLENPNWIATWCDFEVSFHWLFVLYVSSMEVLKN